MGNTLTAHDGRHAYTYNQAGRLSEFRKDGVLRGQYSYNALGQRTIVARYDSSGVQTATVLYFYDRDGQLESELRYDPTGQLQHITDYVYLENKPLAWTRAYYNAQGGIWKKKVYYLHTDHLNTPRLATDDQQTVVWRWDSEGFGSTLANTDPDGDGTNVNINLRFPGQYYDSESGLHYNYFRYYDPSTARYVTSDLIGLAGGLNPYQYANASPLLFFDFFGLDTCTYLGMFKVGDPYSYLERGRPERKVLFKFNLIHYGYGVGGKTPDRQLRGGGPPIDYGPVPLGYWINEVGYYRTKIYRIEGQLYEAKYECIDGCGNKDVETIDDKIETKELIDVDYDPFLENVGYKPFK